MSQRLPKVWHVVLVALVAIVFTAAWLGLLGFISGAIWPANSCHPALEHPGGGACVLPACWAGPEVSTGADLSSMEGWRTQ